MGLALIIRHHIRAATLVLFLLALIPVLPKAQPYFGTGAAIPNNGTTVSFEIAVNGLTPSTLDTIHGLESVFILLAHTAVEQLRISLLAPDGTDILLTDGIGGTGDNFAGTNFADSARISIFHGKAPFVGSFRPIDAIGYMNNGKGGNGIWKLRILDTQTYSDVGTLFNWKLTFGPNPGKPYRFQSSNLPLVFIDTYNNVIVDDPKIMAGIKIIDNGTANLNYPGNAPAYQGFIGIEVRGSSSQQFPKKSFGFETWEASGNEIDVSLFGMPAQSDWILNANYSDKTMLRNAMAYQLWQDMGHYATRYRYVEVFLNNRYRGVYLFSEKIKRDKNRVDIPKITTTDNSGDKLTGGYIIKIDKQTGSGGAGWKSNFPPLANPNGQFIFYQYEYPKAENITPSQKTYIQVYVDSFEVALKSTAFANQQTGWRKYAVENTFIDYFIVNEFSKNVDGYRLSTFMHKQRNSLGEKLRMGPVWDYDLAWRNADYCGGNSTSGWAYQFPCTYDYWQVPFWWQRLLQDATFANNLRCRWSLLRQNILSNTSINAYIDSQALLLAGAQQRNFTIWPIIGMYVWPNPTPFPATYALEIAALKSYAASRLTWIDSNMPGICSTVGSGDIGSIDNKIIMAFPNPTTGLFSLEFGTWESGAWVELAIFDVKGTLVMQQTFTSAGNRISTDISHLPKGYYHILLKSSGSIKNTRIAKISGTK